MTIKSVECTVCHKIHGCLFGSCVLPCCDCDMKDICDVKQYPGDLEEICPECFERKQNEKTKGEK